MSLVEFRLPDVGEGLAEAVIVRWLANEGEPVTRMAPMIEIETAKSVVEIPSPVSGVMIRHAAAEGETIDIGAVLAVLREEAAAGTGSVPTSPAGPLDPPVLAPVRTAPPSAPQVAAAPTVRRKAYLHGIDLADVAASGPGGRVLMSDLNDHLTRTVQQPTQIAPSRAGGRTVPLSPLRSAIFDTLSRAWRDVPLITDMREADASGLQHAKAVLGPELPSGRLTYTTLFCAVVVAALSRHPEFNASLDAEARAITYHDSVDLGLAISVPGGLMVGVVPAAETMPLRDLAAAVESMAERARTGKLAAEQLRDATITVSSFGAYGGWYGTPLVVPPQLAVTGFGPVQDRVVAVDGQPVVRPTVPLSVSADHRVIDGAELSTFCTAVERLLADPIRLLAV